MFAAGTPPSPAEKSVTLAPSDLNQAEKIDGLTKAISALDERIQAIRGDLDEVKRGVDGARNQLHQLETQIVRIDEALKYAKERLDRPDPSERLARVEEGLKSARERFDQRDSRRFEIIKIIVGAFVVAIIGGAVGAGYQWLPKVFEAMRTHRGSPTEKP